MTSHPEPDDHHGLIVEAYRTHTGWHVHVMTCPDLDTRDQLIAASAIADAITDTQRTLLEQLAQQN